MCPTVPITHLASARDKDDAGAVAGTPATCRVQRRLKRLRQRKRGQGVDREVDFVAVGGGGALVQHQAGAGGGGWRVAVMVVVGWEEESGMVLAAEATSASPAAHPALPAAPSLYKHHCLCSPYTLGCPANVYYCQAISGARHSLVDQHVEGLAGGEVVCCQRFDRGQAGKVAHLAAAMRAEA